MPRFAKHWLLMWIAAKPGRKSDGSDIAGWLKVSRRSKEGNRNCKRTEAGLFQERSLPWSCATDGPGVQCQARWEHGVDLWCNLSRWRAWKSWSSRVRTSSCEMACRTSLGTAKKPRTFVLAAHMASAASLFLVRLPENCESPLRGGQKLTSEMVIDHPHCHWPETGWMRHTVSTEGRAYVDIG